MAKSKSKSKSKSKKKVSTVKAKPDAAEQLPVDEEAQDEMSAGEKFLMTSRPYWPHILLGVLSVIFASVLWTAYQGMQAEGDSQPWRDLNNAMTQASLTNDVSSLKEMAGNYEGKAAGNWALQMAGDNEVNRGISMLPRDRVGGLKLIERGSESLQKVVDAPAKSKTPMLQRRSLFLLGYAKEASWRTSMKPKLYINRIWIWMRNHRFANVSRRGIARCSNPDLVAFYDAVPKL